MKDFHIFEEAYKDFSLSDLVKQDRKFRKELTIALAEYKPAEIISILKEHIIYINLKIGIVKGVMKAGA